MLSMYLTSVFNRIYLIFIIVQFTILIAVLKLNCVCKHRQQHVRAMARVIEFDMRSLLFT